MGSRSCSGCNGIGNVREQKRSICGGCGGHRYVPSTVPPHESEKRNAPMGHISCPGCQGSGFGEWQYAYVRCNRCFGTGSFQVPDPIASMEQSIRRSPEPPPPVIVRQTDIQEPEKGIAYSALAAAVALAFYSRYILNLGWGSALWKGGIFSFAMGVIWSAVVRSGTASWLLFAAAAFGSYLGWFWVFHDQPFF